MTYRIEFSPEAQTDILAIYDYIAAHADPLRALRYIERIERWCGSLSTFPERGSRRDDLRPGLRVAGFERRATIAFQATAGTVTILRVLYGGRDLGDAFADAEGSC